MYSKVFFMADVARNLGIFARACGRRRAPAIR